ncbi:putative glycosidase CRH2 [Coemansia sp. RSA 1813]|nr:putative glycosidase CRH2 [Coemansia sp. RSA 1646]KAJ1772901.1 putative glycosidase CRH2 [Coemansia sp. RSA 1843]KAJ2093473.1 putative glycosidase CRH2 [Coemansia sp. RSA 986]KAJ2217282.1 putative glycosidase CRH2 [Coemansia sp. RSA 487]KAJ2572481.1 putative glycosidase CRH2 [Coemansia sp. RSA 1813]
MAAGTCGTQSCSKGTPCCVSGYCNNNAMYCMPMNCEAQNSFSTSSCWDTAHCVKDSVSFGSSNAFAQIADYKGDPSTAAFVSQYEPSNAAISNGELEMTLVKQSDGKGFGATVINTRAIQYGTVSTVMKSGCLSGGVVSSFIIRNNDVGDEIDFEFVGADKMTVQSNYYWHDQLDYTKMVKSPQVSDTTTNYHTYQIEWTPDKIVWSVDGNAFRTVNRADTWDSSVNAYKYPDSEAYISYSIWDGGSGAQGTSDWAGGAIQWGQGPFVANVKSITIDCYYKGNDTTYVPPGGSSDSKSSSGDDDNDDDKSDSSEGDDDKSDSADSKSDDEASDDSSNDKPSADDEQSGDEPSSEEQSGDEPSSEETDTTGSSGAGSVVASFAAIVSALVGAYLF